MSRLGEPREYDTEVSSSTFTVTTLDGQHPHAPAAPTPHIAAGRAVTPEARPCPLTKATDATTRGPARSL